MIPEHVGRSFRGVSHYAGQVDVGAGVYVQISGSQYSSLWLWNVLIQAILSYSTVKYSYM